MMPLFVVAAAACVRPATTYISPSPTASAVVLMPFSNPPPEPE
jgi:hypothetical protein